MSHGEVYKMWISFSMNAIIIQNPTVGWGYSIPLHSEKSHCYVHTP